jgi:hypothetical protein
MVRARKYGSIMAITDGRRDDDADDQRDPHYRQQQPEAANPGVFDDVSQFHRCNLRDLGVVELGDELSEKQEKEQQAGEASPRFGDGLDDFGAGLESASPPSVAHAGRQETQRDDDDEAVLERTRASSRLML